MTFTITLSQFALRISISYWFYIDWWPFTFEQIRTTIKLFGQLTVLFHAIKYHRLVVFGRVYRCMHLSWYIDDRVCIWSFIERVIIVLEKQKMHLKKLFVKWWRCLSFLNVQISTESTYSSLALIVNALLWQHIYHIRVWFWRWWDHTHNASAVLQRPLQSLCWWKWH